MGGAIFQFTYHFLRIECVICTVICVSESLLLLSTIQFGLVLSILFEVDVKSVYYTQKDERKQEKKQKMAGQSH